MLTKKELGRRLRMARFEKGLTLKDVAKLSGMSATHISEVERGKTSPTISALQRITGALGENPAHFVREENMPQAVFTRADDARMAYNTDATGRPGQFRMLSPGLTGGFSQIFDRVFPPGAVVRWPPKIGEMVVMCTGGAARVTIGREDCLVREGDAIQFRMDEGFVMEAIGDEPTTGIAVYASPGLYPA
jgi:transcriptional regulator with XRE-family HTH domain